jgi:hypothetical protein
VQAWSNAPQQPSSASPPSTQRDDDSSGGTPPSPPSQAPLPTSGPPHYDDKHEVIAQVECLSDTATKRISQVIWGATAAGLGLLIAGLVLVVTKVRIE